MIARATNVDMQFIASRTRNLKNAMSFSLVEYCQDFTRLNDRQVPNDLPTAPDRSPMLRSRILAIENRGTACVLRYVRIRLSHIVAVYLAWFSSRHGNVFTTSYANPATARLMRYRLPMLEVSVACECVD